MEKKTINFSKLEIAALMQVEIGKRRMIRGIDPFWCVLAKMSPEEMKKQYDIDPDFRARVHSVVKHDQAYFSAS